MKQDARKTVSQGSPDQMALQLARVDTMTGAIGESVTKLELALDRLEKYLSNRMLQISEQFNAFAAEQRTIGTQVVKLTEISRNNADQIMELKTDIRSYSDRLGLLECRVEDVAATQRMCPARSLWQNWEEDSKVVRVMQERLQDHLQSRSTPGEGLSVRFRAKKINTVSVVKAVVGALVAAALAVAGYTTAKLVPKDVSDGVSAKVEVEKITRD